VTRAAFFDLDNTVLRIDSGTSYMQFGRLRNEVSRARLAQVVWWALQYRMALLDVEELATRLALDYEGSLEDEIVAKCQVWYESFVGPQVAPAARDAIAAHRRRGEPVVLLTGATQYIADEVARELSFDHCLCTRVEVVGGRFTGRLRQICFGRNKVRIAEEFAAGHGIDLATSRFYSDSYNDLPMLERVGEAIVINPDARLRRHARRVGWPIERWA
jgi:HAD superfamily hydrolase (TIGR01490 family)